MRDFKNLSRNPAGDRFQVYAQYSAGLATASIVVTSRPGIAPKNFAFLTFSSLACFEYCPRNG